jgi:hypothetical protein
MRRVTKQELTEWFEPIEVGVNAALVKLYSLNTFSLVAQETNHEYQAINL